MVGGPEEAQTQSARAHTKNRAQRDVARFPALSINSVTLQCEFLEKQLQFTVLTSTAVAPRKVFLALFSSPIRR